MNFITDLITQQVFLTLCAKNEAEFSDFSEDTVFLNRFYIEEKYPLDITVEHTSEDVNKALDKAGNILDFVEKII